MTNFERNKEKLKKICKHKNKIGLLLCDHIACKGCDHYEDSDIDCDIRALLWLLEDDGEPSQDRLAGQNEAWELAQKIVKSECEGGLSDKEQTAIFGSVSCWRPIANNTYAEAAEKVRAWEESKEPKIGDEYFSKLSESKFIVTKVDASAVYVIWTDGSTGAITFDVFGKHYVKTGRTLPVEDWLRQIGGEE